MLSVLSEFQGAHASDGRHGNLNNFMRSLIVEVVAENYRQTLAEDLLLQDLGSDQLLDPPLRANERTLSGLFSAALNRLCPFVRPESSLRRDTAEGGESSIASGRLDYLAWYSNRILGVELKAGFIRYDSDEPRRDTLARWGATIKQIETAQSFLRAAADSDARLQKPVSIAIMVISGRSARIPDWASDESLDSEHDLFKSALRSFKPRPQYVATYVAPLGFREIARRKRHFSDPSKALFVPFYGFIARARIHTQ